MDCEVNRTPDESSIDALSTGAPAQRESVEDASASVALAGGLAEAAQRLSQLRDAVSGVVVGQNGVIDGMLIGLLCGGHVLLEGVPGTAKTLAVRCLAKGLACRAKRIQFTPDLMPSDIVGTNVFDLSTSTFVLHQGPVFTDLLLADEINRAPAKTQSALLEAMSEGHATIDGVRHELSPIFSVFATQNPVELEGTYPLPEAQQDRFLLKVRVDYPPLDSERAILQAVHQGTPLDTTALERVPPILSLAAVAEIRQALPEVRVEPTLIDYVLKVVRATRNNESILIGAGPRGSIALLSVSKARALLSGRDFVTPDDVVAMVGPVLEHRLTITADADIQGTTAAEILQGILDELEVPR